ncbi:MAG TPA: hypothetical protein VLW50_09925 [Streptosporangiaceae bacterium]|nr:hypothetical protein [Streptosporangiaceae bacterium]
MSETDADRQLCQLEDARSRIRGQKFDQGDYPWRRELEAVIKKYRNDPQFWRTFQSLAVQEHMADCRICGHVMHAAHRQCDYCLAYLEQPTVIAGTVITDATALAVVAETAADEPARCGVLDEPLKPCGCLSWGEACPECNIHPCGPEYDRYCVA